MGGILNPAQQQQLMQALGGAQATGLLNTPTLPGGGVTRTGGRRHFATAMPWGMNPMDSQNVLATQLREALLMPPLPTRIGKIPSYKEEKQEGKK